MEHEGDVPGVARTATAPRRPPWRALALAVAVVVLGAVAWAATRPTTTTFCTLAGYLPPGEVLVGGGAVPRFEDPEAALAWWWSEGGGQETTVPDPDEPLRLSPEGGQPVTPAALRPSGPGDFERRGDDWAWELGDGRELRVQLVEEPGGWTIVGVNECEVRRG